MPQLCPRRSRRCRKEALGSRTEASGPPTPTPGGPLWKPGGVQGWHEEGLLCRFPVPSSPSHERPQHTLRREDFLVAVHLQVRQQRMKLNGRDAGDVQTRSGVDGTAPMST